MMKIEENILDVNVMTCKKRVFTCEIATACICFVNPKFCEVKCIYS